jgi:glycosyltransferase involved in cell wall biosynthesis
MLRTRLIMLGATAETRGSIATVVGTYRAHDLFKRWPIRYLPTEGAAALKAARTLAGELLRGPVAVHAHVAARGFWRDAAVLASALAMRSRVLLQLHGSGFERLYDDAGPFARSVIRGILERAACVIVPCESLRAWVRMVGRDAHAVTLPNPVSIEPLAKDSGRPNLVLFLGHMAPDKGVFDLLEALSAARAALPDVRLVCAGDGDRISVARYAERLGISDAVKFTGWVGPSGKRALFEAAAVLAAPSYDAALPMSLLEAMAAGVPVVATAVGGIPEALQDGVNGFLVAPGDSASLARVLRKLLVERALAERVGAAGRDSVRLRHAPERALPRLEAIYATMGIEPTGAAPRETGLKKAA